VCFFAQHPGWAKYGKANDAFWGAGIFIPDFQMSNIYQASQDYVFQSS